MTQHFNLRRLMNRHGEEVFIMVEGEGYYDDFNHWHPGELEEVPIKAMVVNLSGEELIFDRGGKYEQGDMKLYIYKDIEVGETIKWDNENYTIFERSNLTGRDAGLFSYIIRRGS